MRSMRPTLRLAGLVDPKYAQQHAAIKASLSQSFGHTYTSLHGASYPGVYSKTAPGGGLKASGADLVARMSAEDVVRYAKYEADLAAGRVPDSGYAQEHAAIKASLSQSFGHTYTSLHGASYPGVYSSTAPGGKVLSSSADLVSRMSPQDIAMYAKYEADLAAGRAVDPKYAQQHAAIKASLSQSFGHTNTSLHGASYPGVYSKTAPGGGLKASGADLVACMSAEDVVRYAKYEADLAAGRVPDSGYAQEHAAIKASLSQSFGHTYTSLHGASYPGVYNSTAPGGKVLSSLADLVSRMSPQDIAMYAKYEADLAAGRAVDPKYAQQHAAIKASLSQSFGHTNTSLHGASYPGVYSKTAPGGGLKASGADLVVHMSAEDVVRYVKYEADLATGHVPDSGYAQEHAAIKASLSQSFGHTYTSLHGASYPGVYNSTAPGGKVLSSSADLVSRMSPQDIAMYAKYEADLAAGRAVDPKYAQQHAAIKASLSQSFGHTNTSLHGASYPGVYSKTAPGGGLKASGANLVARMSAEDVVRYAKYEADLAAGRVPDSGYAQEHTAIKASLSQSFGHTYTSLHGASYPGVYSSTAPGGKVLSSSADLVSRMSPQDIAMYAKYEADLAAGRAVDPKYAQQHAAIKAGLGQSFGRSKKYGHSKQHEMNRKLQFGHSWSSLHHAMYPNVYQAVAPGGKVKASTKDLLSQLSADDIAMYAKYEADSAAGRQVNAAYAQKHAQIKEALREGQSLSDATSGIEPSFGRLRQPHELLMQPPIMTSFGAPCHHVSTSHALNMGIPLEILMDRGTRAMAGPEQKRFDDLKEIQKKMRMTPNDEKVLHEVLSSSKNTEEVTAALQRYFGNVLSSSTLKVLAGSHVNVHKTVARCIQENPEHGNKCITQSLATKTIILAKATAYLMRVLKHRFSEENIREIASYLSMLYKWT